MECPRGHALLVVLTLLQLCRAGHIHPRWYSARLNDGYDQRPILDRAQQPSFSTANPIVVTHPSSEGINNIGYSSTLPPTSNMIYSTLLPTSSTPPPPLYKQVNVQPQRHVQVQAIPETESLPYSQLYPFVQTFVPSDIEPRLQLVSEQSHRNSLNQHIEPLGPSSLPVQNLFQPSTITTETLQSQEPIATRATDPTSTPNPNLVLVYQPSSETIPDFSLTPVSEVTIGETSSGTLSTSPITRTSEFSSTTRSVSTATTPATTIISSTSPITVSTAPSTVGSTSATRVTVTPSSTLGSTTRLLPCRDNIGTLGTVRPRILNTNSSLSSLRIRVIAPSGSITNVNINPSHDIKTEKPKPTTTKKPKTKRTSKPKKNSYDRCLDGCKKVKDQICAAPLGHYSVGAKDLKSFTSVCHMACHNSFKEDAYEKVDSGSCDKIRKKIGNNANIVLRTEPPYYIQKNSDTLIELSKDVLTN